VFICLHDLFNTYNGDAGTLQDITEFLYTMRGRGLQKNYILSGNYGVLIELGSSFDLTASDAFVSAIIRIALT
jgi:hypothetical protein